MRISFKNDYAEGCHPQILHLLSLYNEEQQNGYGLDSFCLEAEQLIKDEFNAGNSKVFFVSGGTQANLISAACFLKPFESIIAADSGHINTNETGAIEATGHRINSISSGDGKIYPKQIRSVLDQHRNVPHQVRPKMVYISQASELGTVYNKEELVSLKKFCTENGLFLYMDGARLAHALASEASGLLPQDIAENTDAFYFGATKNGGLLGEAVVINNPELQEDFGFHMKQRGALLAKGRILGIQFLALLRSRLYLELAAHANSEAAQIADAFRSKDITFRAAPQTNQLFPVLTESQIAFLAEDFDFYEWQKIDENKTAVRLMTSWATQPENTDKLINKIGQL